MITTVKGNISSEEIKYVLPHEHLLSDLRPLVAEIDDEDFYKEISLSNFGKLTRNPYAILDNAYLGSTEVAAKELGFYKKAGGSLVADVTTADFGRDVKKLLEISEKSGVNIVAGCGRYIDCAVPENVKSFSVAELRDEMLRELFEGIDGTDIRAGVIGEIGSSGEMTEFEKRSLKAAAEAQREAKCGMHIHACLWNDEGLRALKYAVSCGADAEKICVDHADVLLNEDYILGMLNEGAYVEFDDFGKEFYVDRKNRNLLLGSFASDVQRVKFITKLIERGFVKQILVSNDICLKSMMHTYGGWGYDHVLTNIIPMMEDFGISESDIDMIMTKNPLRFLERI